MLKQSKMNQNLHKNTIELLWCWSARSPNGVHLGVWLIFPVSLHWGKTNPPFAAILIADSFLFRGGVYGHFPFLVLGLHLA